MPLAKLLKNLFAFKEPRAEPEFVMAWDEPGEIGPEEKKATFQASGRALEEGAAKPELTGDIRSDSELVVRFFGGRRNQVLGCREFAADRALSVFYLNYLVDAKTLTTNILEPLTGLQSYEINKVLPVLPVKNAVVTEDLGHGLAQLCTGQALIMIQGEKRMILADAGGAARRQVSRSIHERVVKGPQEGFTEDLTTNLSLIQKRFRSHRLRIETVEVGSLSRTSCAVLSLDGITNPRLLKEVKRRLAGAQVSHLTDSGMLEQLIEDNFWHPYPQILTTERPDRIAAALDEGRVAVIVDGSNVALAMPVTVIGLLHSPEDYSVRWPYAIYLRLVRIFAAFIILFLPAVYVAVNLYQPELVPTDIFLSLVAIKQRNPLPTILELLMLEFTFEILREAGFRGPRNMAAPLTIVVGVLLGLVSAFTGFINPVLLAVISLTGLATFLMPEYSVALSFRLTRYLYTFLAFIYGFIGIAFGGFIHLHLLAKQKSFGVPMLAPIGPFTRRSGDVILMRPLAGRKNRPDFLDPLNRQKKPQQPQAWKEEQEQPGNTPVVPKEGEKPHD